MAIEVRMPKLSDNMEAGTIIRWLKQPGDTVQHGEALAEVETDKADVELEAENAGVLREIRVNEGQSAEVGAVIAVLAGEGETAGRDEETSEETDAAGADGHAPAGAGRGETKAAPAPREKPARRDDDARQSPSAAPAAEAAPRNGPSTGSGQGPSAGSGQGILRASPLAWRMAEEAGLSLANVKGSGPGGRILKRDVEALLSRARDNAAADRDRKRTTPPATTPPQAPPSVKADGEAEPESAARPTPPPGKGRVEEQSRMRLTIARRMAEANREIPHFYLTTEIDMSEAWRLRQSIKESETIPGLTLTHVIIKALALTLPHHPRVNASWHDGGVELHDDVNVGIAVAVEDGLIVPVLHQVQNRALRDIAAAVASLAEKARSGRFGGQDLTGATFSVSNLGMLDVDEFSAIITPPQAAILAVGAVKERPVVRAGQLTLARTMRVTLSCDHRVLNGVEGGRFLGQLKSLLESPYVLLVE